MSASAVASCRPPVLEAAPPDAAPIRVAFVLHVMQVAGAEVLVCETIRRLGSRIVPTVLCLDGVGPLGRQLQDEGVDVVALGRRPGRDWRVAWRLARELKARRIEIVQAHQYTPFFYAALACALRGVRRPRLILTEHGRHYPDVVSTLRRLTNRWVLDHLADAVNAVCAFSAESLARNDGFAARRIEVIANGIEVDRYRRTEDRSALRRRLRLDPGRRYVANVARLHQVKDQATLLRGFATVAANLPDVDLLLVGDGPLRQELTTSVAKLGLEGRVHFLGVRSDVPDILRAVDAFALTSVSEAASLTLLEAMAAGLPVVVTDVGGNPEIVRHGQEGLLVPRGDGAAVGAGLQQLLGTPALATAMGRAGQCRVQQQFRLEQTVSAYERLYRRLLAQS